MARKPDAIDELLQRWAKKRRELLGITPMQRPLARDYVGPLTCTLGNVKDTWDGASSRTAKDQHYPEVYPEDDYETNRAIQHMPGILREIVEFHYVYTVPIKTKLPVLDIASSEYWARVNRAKSFVEGWAANVQTK
jgi:hypothetical protein